MRKRGTDMSHWTTYVKMIKKEKQGIIQEVDFFSLSKSEQEKTAKKINDEGMKYSGLVKRKKEKAVK